MKLKGRTIVITGGTGGIGYEIVQHLQQDNRVVVIARSPDRLAALQDKFPSIHTYQADLSKPSQIESAANSIKQKHTVIDVLINNAAVQYTPTFLDTDFDYETIVREITLNFTAVCALCYLLVPHMLKAPEAAIVNVNSGLGLTPKKTSAVYCATKGALNIFSQSLRYQLADTNIKVQQAIMPLVDTAMTEGRGAGKMTAKEAAYHLIKGVKQGIDDHDIGKVKLLRFLVRFWPSMARKIMKNS